MDVKFLSVIGLIFLIFIKVREKKKKSCFKNTCQFNRILRALPEFLRPTTACLQGEGRSASTYLRHLTAKTKTNLLRMLFAHKHKYINTSATPNIIFFVNLFNVLKKPMLVYIQVFIPELLQLPIRPLNLTPNSNIRSIQKASLDRKVPSHWTRYIKIHIRTHTPAVLVQENSLASWLREGWVTPTFEVSKPWSLFYNHMFTSWINCSGIQPQPQKTRISCRICHRSSSSPISPEVIFRGCSCQEGGIPQQHPLLPGSCFSGRVKWRPRSLQTQKNFLEKAATKSQKICRVRRQETSQKFALP